MEENNVSMKNQEETPRFITLKNAAGEDLRVEFLDTMEYKGKSYVALQPEEADGYIVYEYLENQNKDFKLLNIDDDDFFDEVADAFEKKFDEAWDDDDEYEELDDVEEDELDNHCSCGDNCSCENECSDNDIDQHCHCDSLNDDEEEEDMEQQKISMELMDGTVIECEVIDTIEFKGKDFISLAPDNSEEIWIYELIQDPEGEGSIFKNIEDLHLFNEVRDMFAELLEDHEDFVDTAN